MQYSQPESYWQASIRTSFENTSSPQYLGALPQYADVAVLGGGVHGACALYWLARHGLSAVLIERELPAAGASGRNGGLCVSGPAASYVELSDNGQRDLARRITQHTRDGYRMLRDALIEESIDAQFRPNGHVTLALNVTEFDAMRRGADLLAQDGFDARALSRAELANQIATPLADEIAGGILIADAAQLHSGRLVYGLLAAAQRHGAHLALGAPRIDRDRMRIGVGDAWMNVGAICVCVNAWTRDLLPDLTIPVTPVRGQALCYAPSPAVFSHGFGAGVTETGEYWQQLPGGEIVIGGCRTLAPNRDVDVHGVDVDPAVQAGIEAVLPRLFPRLRDLRVARRWSGTMGFSPDHNPIFDKAPAAPIYFTGGFSGHGMPFAMTFGRWLAESVRQGAPVEAARIYSLARFGALNSR